jgi:MFS family permease
MVLSTSCEPFRSCDFVKLFFTNIAEFCGATLFKLATLQFLFEETGSGLALGGLGFVMLLAMVPATLYGGVLADTVDRKKLVAVCMAVACVLCALLGVMEAFGALRAWHIYVATAVHQASRRLEGSARGVLVATTVPTASVPNAISIVTVVQMAGEVLAPILFAAAAAFPSLAPAFLFGAASYAPAALLPLLIRVTGHAEGAPTAPGKGARAAVSLLSDGIRYILAHPLLPGLYALDWGLTLFTFYRELFPFFVAALFTRARLGLSARQAAAALTIANYVGGTIGSSLTLFFNSYKYKGRAVCYATLAYGAFAALVGVSPLLPVGMLFVSLCGATDAVGMTFRKTVVLLTTPDHLRGRAQAGHSLAANVANALGQMYVAAMGTAIGLPATMVLGGGLTWAAVGLAVWHIPKLWRDASSSTASDNAECTPGMEAAEELAEEAPAPSAAVERSERRGRSRLLQDGSAQSDGNLA